MCVTSILIVSLLIPSAVYAQAERVAQNIIIVMNDGRVFEGELLAVMNKSLVVGDSSLELGIEVNIEDVDHITVVKQTKLLKGLGRGFLIGAVTGALLGFISGNDKEGMIQFSASEKALFMGVLFGGAGAIIGGIASAMSGIDNSVNIASVSPSERYRALTDLKLQARYRDTLPENIAILPAPTVNVITGHQTGEVTTNFGIIPKYDKKRVESHNRKSKIHLSVTPGIFISSGMGQLEALMREINFDDSHTYLGNWFSGGLVTVEYPDKIQNTYVYLKDIKLDYSINDNFTMGFAYTPLGKHGVSGRRVVSEIGDNIDTYLSGFYRGNTYFITSSYFPPAPDFWNKETFKLTAGFGIGKSTMDFYGSQSKYDYESPGISPNVDHKKFSNMNYGVLCSAEILHSFNKKWFIGMNIDYKWVAFKTDKFSINSQYSYYNPGHSGEGEIRSDIPGRTWNFGGFGFGVILGLNY